MISEGQPAATAFLAELRHPCTEGGKCYFRGRRRSGFEEVVLDSKAGAQRLTPSVRRCGPHSIVGECLKEWLCSSWSLNSCSIST